MVGLPYPNIKSPELTEKMQYLNSTQVGLLSYMYVYASMLCVCVCVFCVYVCVCACVAQGPRWTSTRTDPL